MTRQAGPLREARGLREAGAWLDGLASWSRVALETVGDMELANMLEVARLVVQAAAAREESRGAHYRLDYPGPGAAWEKHIIFKR